MKPGEVFNPFGMFRGIYVPEAILRHAELSPGSKLLYGSLCRYAGKDGACFPSIRRLAIGLGKKPRQVQEYVGQLEQFRLIRRVSEPGKLNSFQFLWHQVFEGEPPQESAPVQESAGVQETAREGCRKARGPLQESASPYRKKEVIKEVSEESPSFEVWFAEFWELYPKKVGKPDGLKAAKAKGKTEAERLEILTGLKAHLPEYLNRDEDFIPHPATFLRKEFWKDKPRAVRNGSGRPDRYEEKDRKVSEAFDSLIAGRIENGRQIH